MVLVASSFAHKRVPGWAGKPQSKPRQPRCRGLLSPQASLGPADGRSLAMSSHGLLLTVWTGMEVL